MIYLSMKKPYKIFIFGNFSHHKITQTLNYEQYIK